MENNSGNTKKSIFIYFVSISAAMAVAVVVYFFFYRFDGVMSFVNRIIAILMPFIYGAAFAYLLNPLCNFFENKFLKLFSKLKNSEKISGTLSILVSVVIAVALIVLFFLAVIPQIYDSISGIVKMAPAAYSNAEKIVNEQLQNYPEQAEYIEQQSGEIYTKLQNWMSTDMLNSIGQLAGSVGSRIGNVVTVFKDIFLGFLVTVYVLAFRRKFARQAKLVLYGLIPEKAARIIHEEVKYADKMFSGFLYGKVVDSTIIGIICFIGCVLMGIEYPVLISVIVGVTNIIPFFGPYIGMIPCVLILLIVNPMHSLYFFIFIMILQQIDGNYIGPKILGNTTGLSSFWVLFSILFFGGVWGFVGMIVGVPVFATIYDIIRKLTYRGLKKKNITNIN